MIALAWPVSGRMGFQLMPPLPQPWINLRVSLPVDAPRDVAEAVRARMLDAAYAVIDEHGRAGTAERVESEAGTGYARLHVRLPDEGVRVLTKGQWIAAFRRAMGPVPEATATNFGGEPGGEGPTTGPGAAGAISIEIAHPDEGRLATASEDLQRRLLRFTAVTDVDDGRDGGTRRLTFALNEMGRSLGFTEAMVAEQVRASFLGIEVLTEPRGRDEVTVRVSPPYRERQRENFVERLVLTGPDGVRAPLYAIAEVRRDRVPGRIDRTSGGRTITMSAMATPPEAASDVVRALAEEVLPGLRQAHPGLTTALGGDEKAKRETIESFPVSIGLTLALMYGALAIPFRSWWQPLIVMAAIPFGVGGAILGHLIMDKGLSVVSIFGMIALGGVVINAALVMIDYANKRRAEGWGPIEAMQAAGERRFRPILLTTLTTFGGLAPMIFDDSREAAFLVPIAISMGYGILFATVAVMFIVPCLYLVLEDFRRLADPRAPLSLRVPMAVSGPVSGVASGPVSGPVSGAASSPGGAAPPPASG
ncbi:MAG: efflux RND transporter permease subunit, partial [Pseudomonadota bacterium]